MDTITSYLSPLLSQLSQKQVSNNLGILVNKMISTKESRLYTLSSDTTEYVKNCRMLNGKLKTIVDTEKLMISQLQNSTPFFKDLSVVCVVHDFTGPPGGPIRKPESHQLDGLGKVKSLDNHLISGYDTFNSVMVDVKGHSVRLLACTPLSNGVPSFVSLAERKAYETGQLADKERREAIQQYDKSGESHNNKTVSFNQLRKISAHMKVENPQATVIDIYDRGFDDAALFELETQLGHHFIVRGKANRNSNEIILDEKGQPKAVKLMHQRFFKGEEVLYPKISFRNKIYLEAKGIFEWNEVEINHQIYSVLRVAFYQKNGQRIFKDDMLLITNLTIPHLTFARLVWELYMQRPKIEAVFKFCKQELHWESPRIDDWTTMKNLFSLVYFVAGYFYEIGDDLCKDPSAQWICKLANGKGKVSVHFLLKGIAKVMAYLEIQEMLAENIIEEGDLREVIDKYTTCRNL